MSHSWDDDERAVITRYNPWKRTCCSAAPIIDDPLINIKRCIVVDPYEYMFVDSESDDDESIILDCNYCAKSSSCSDPSSDISNASDTSDASDPTDIADVENVSKDDVIDSTVHITPFFYT